MKIKYVLMCMLLCACGEGAIPDPPLYVETDAGTVGVDPGIPGLTQDAGVDAGIDAGVDTDDNVDAGIKCKNGYGWGDHNHCHHHR